MQGIIYILMKFFTVLQEKRIISVDLCRFFGTLLEKKKGSRRRRKKKKGEDKKEKGRGKKTREETIRQEQSYHL